MEATATRKRNRRTFQEILKDLENRLVEMETNYEVRRNNLLGRIVNMKYKHEELALAVETIGDRSREEVEAELEQQLSEIKARKAALRRLR